MNVGQSANKQVLLTELLGLGMVLVALDARREGVDVPAHLAEDAQLRLNLSYRFGLPMAIDARGIAATLTFGGVPHHCQLPWSAIFLLVSHINGEPYLFADDVPEELLHKSATPFGWRLREAMLPVPRARPQLTLLSSLGPNEALRSSLAPRGRKKAGGRRASGGFAAAARRIDQEQARLDATRPQAPSSSTSEADGCAGASAESAGHDRRSHLRVVK